MTSMSISSEHPEELISLAYLPVGKRARIEEMAGGRQMVRRLLSLGLRVGSEVEVVQHRGRGVVVASHGIRVALGGGVAEKLLILPLEPASEE
jgi:ferrous iron transport protein A